MKVVVTGAAGFIGSHVIEHLVARGASVTGIDDLSTGRLENTETVDIEMHVGSILDSTVLDRATRKADAIVHLAARPSVPRSIADPVASHDANTAGTLAVLEAARREHAYVLAASSSSVYGANPQLPKHEDLATLPRSPYAATKLATEQYTLAWQHSYQIPALAFRFFNVFGPRQMPGHAYAAVVPSFAAAALSGEPLVVHGDGGQTRDFTFVGDVAAVIADAAIGQVASDGPVNLAFGTRTSLVDLIARLQSLVGTDLHTQHVEARVGDVRHSQAANDRLRELFPSATATPLDDGLGATLAWMRTYLESADPS